MENVERFSPVDSRIRIPFLPEGWKSGLGGTVTKDENGKKRRYLVGVASGTEVDAHGERMSENAVKSFMEQANRGQVFLFPDIHGIRPSEDIAVLEKGEVSPDGEWRVEFRLYDEADGIGPVKLEKIDAIWRQAAGLPPYEKPLPKGFSIEGVVPEGGAYREPNGTKVLDQILLDGVCLVSRPAYTNAMVQRAVEKSLSGQTSGRRRQLQAKQAAKSLLGGEIGVLPGYWHRRRALDDVLDCAIAHTLRTVEKPIDIEDQLEEVAVQYGKKLVTLVMECLPEVKAELQEYESPYGGEESSTELSKELAAATSELTKALSSFIEKRKQTR